MKTMSISVTEAARNFAECVNRAHYQNMTFIPLKNGSPVARLVPDGEKAHTVGELAKAMMKATHANRVPLSRTSPKPRVRPALW